MPARSGQPDSLRQAAHSGRELIDQVIKIAAPDDEVKTQAWFGPDKSSRTGVTRRMRLRLCMEKCRGQTSSSDLDVAEAACDLVLAVANDLANESHARAQGAPEKVAASLQALEAALKLILVAQ
jgi:hypothetical protein